MHIGLIIKNIKEGSNVNVGDHVWISKDKKISPKVTLRIKKVKNTMSRTVISDLNSKEIIRNFYEKALQKENLN